MSGDKVDESLYRSIIQSLLYLTFNRSNIAFVVGVCAQYRSYPCASHLHSSYTYLGTVDYMVYGMLLTLPLFLLGIVMRIGLVAQMTVRIPSGGYFSLKIT